MKKYVYFFGKKDNQNLTDGNRELKQLLGGKGANLAEMANLNIRVPPGFTITTEVCKIFNESGTKVPDYVMKEVHENIKKIEDIMKKKFGSSGEDLLLVSVRSGAAASMPGMMDTILNLGLNDNNVKSFAKATKNPKFAWDSYRRLIQMFSNVVLNVDTKLFEEELIKIKEKTNAKIDQDLTEDALIELVGKYKEIIKRTKNIDFPQDPNQQLLLSIEAVFKSWMNPRAIYYRRMNKIEGLIGTAVNVQSMVFGNFSTKSGTGVAFSRSPATGENKFFGEFLINAQGEDVVAGVRTPMHIDEMAKHFPNAYKELTEIYKKLENHYRDVQDLEFTVQDEILYMLQTRNAKRTAKAAIKIAVDLVSEGLITKKEAILRMDSAQLDHLLHKQLDPEEKKKIKPIGKGIPASPGAAVGKIAFNNEEAVQMKKNKFPVILVRPETSPEDLIGMDAASGILTSTGGTTSHAAVVARTMGKTCISGCTEAKVNEAKGTLTIGDDVFKSGDFITLDGTEGKIYKGVLKVIDPEFSDEFYVFMGWEKEFRQLGVRANGDTPLDAERAIKFGAEGIGLCRTEHMFFDKDRIKVVREMILSKDEKGRRAVLEKIKPFQQKDFYELFKTMDGRPITIRLLDPPLHEFLPQDEEQIKELAEDLKYSVLEVKETIKSLHEINPMLGHRGCRLGISYPEITEMQAEAIFSAVKQIVDEGLPCDPEIMIPLIGTKKEFTLQKEILDKIALKILGGKIKYKIGTMIETPRAAIVSESIATEAEFFSFGTNDLTQMTFGYSRDDSNKFLPDYVEKYNILSASPFEVLDQEGVGFLMQKSVTDGRSINSKLKVGICGEHGGDPSSIDFCQRIGLDYVSCSPFRVFIARLAAAQSAIKNSQKK